VNPILRRFLDAHPKYWDDLTVDEDDNDMIDGPYMEDFIRWRAKEGGENADVAVAKLNEFMEMVDDIENGDGWKHGYVNRGDGE